MKSPMTQKRLKELVHYDKKTGIITSLVHRQKSPVGTQLGTINKGGYSVCWIDKTLIPSVRLAFLYEHGYLPKESLQFIDGDKTNLTIKNIRIKPARLVAIKDHESRPITGGWTYYHPETGMFDNYSKDVVS